MFDVKIIQLLIHNSPLNQTQHVYHHVLTLMLFFSLFSLFFCLSGPPVSRPDVFWYLHLVKQLPFYFHFNLQYRAVNFSTY